MRLATKVDCITGEVTVIEIDDPVIPDPTPDMVDAERDRRTSAGIEWNGARFQTRPQDRENIAGATILAIGALAAGADPASLRWANAEQDFGWIAEDNTVVPLTAPDMIAFGKAVAAEKSRLIFVARGIKSLDQIPTDFADDGYWQ